MSGARSSKISENYKFNKTDFNKKINLLNDSIDVAQFYSNQLGTSLMPISLSRYHNYNDISEEYFNTKRKENNTLLSNQNVNVRNVYDFYIELSNLQKDYENPNFTEIDKRNKIKLVVDTANSVTKMIISELTDDDLYVK